MNFVCLVFELGDKTLTLSPMENLMVKCNLQDQWSSVVSSFPLCVMDDLFFFLVAVNPEIQQVSHSKTKAAPAAIL